MRQARLGGSCAACGKTAPDGLYWENCLVVLDPGGDVAPMEPDTTQPIRCDACELLARAYSLGRVARASGKSRVLAYPASADELAAWLRGWDEG